MATSEPVKVFLRLKGDSASAGHGSMFNVTEGGCSVTITPPEVGSSRSEKKGGSGSSAWQTPARFEARNFRMHGTIEDDFETFSRVRDEVEAVALGYNATVIACGSAGADAADTLTDDRTGVITRSLSTLFARASEAREGRVELRISMVEQTGNSFHDLLAPEGPAAAALALHEPRGRGVFLTGSPSLRTRVDSLAQALDLVQQGTSKRRAGSHMLFIVDCCITGPGDEERNGRLYVVDLAIKGKDESNMTVSALGDVLGAVSRTKDLWLVPYKTSQLTYLLRDGMGGTARTVVIAHCEDNEAEFRNSLATLVWASQMVDVAPAFSLGDEDRQSEVDALHGRIRALEAERDALKDDIEDLRASSGASSRRASGDVGAMQSKIRDLTERLQVSERLADPHLFQRLEDTVAELSEERAKVVTIGKERQAAEEAVLMAAERVEQMRAKHKKQIAEWKEKLKASKSDLTESSSSLAVSMEQANEAVKVEKHRRREVEQKALDLTDEIDKMRQLLRVARDEITKGASENERLRSQRDALAEKFQELAGKIDTTMIKKEHKLTEKLGEAQQAMKRLEAQHREHIATLEREADDRVSKLERAHKRALKTMEQDCDRTVEMAENDAEKRIARADVQAERRIRQIEDQSSREKLALERELNELRDTVRAAEARRIAAAVRSTVGANTGLLAVAPGDAAMFGGLNSSVEDSSSDWESSYRAKKVAARKKAEAAVKEASDKAQARATAMARAKAQARAKAKAEEHALASEEAVAVNDAAKAKRAKARAARRARAEAKKKAEMEKRQREMDGDISGEEDMAPPPAKAPKRATSKPKQTKEAEAEAPVAEPAAAVEDEENNPAVEPAVDEVGEVADTGAGASKSSAAKKKSASASKPGKKRLFTDKGANLPAASDSELNSSKVSVSSTSSGLFNKFTDKKFLIPKLRVKN